MRRASFPFINHHWLTGVVFFGFWRLFSFEGLTILNAVLVSAALLIFYLVGERGFEPAVRGSGRLGGVTSDHLAR